MDIMVNKTIITNKVIYYEHSNDKKCTFSFGT